MKTMQGQHYVALLLPLLTGVSGLWIGYPVRVVETSPNDIYVAVGNELVLNCTLGSSYLGPLNATHLFFDHTSMPSHAVEHVVDSRKRQLRIAGVQMSDAGTYSCYLNETLIGGTERSLTSAAFTNVHVGEPPPPVTRVTCVSDNFQSMTCTWCPADKPSNMTSWKLYWSVRNMGGVCPDSQAADPCSCRFCESDCKDGISHSFLRYLTYNLSVVNSNGRVQSQVEVKASHRIVKPWPVTDLAVQSHTSTSMVVTWMHPKRLDRDWFPLIYEVLYWKDGKKVVQEVSNELNITLTTLHPFTTYNISVRGRPEHGPLWSEREWTWGTTDPTDPASPPTFLLGSFRTVPYTSTSEARNIIIFFQPIPPKNQNGMIKAYEVSCHRVDDMSLVSRPINTTILSATLRRLDTRRSYVIGVQAYNSIGRSAKEVLYVPKSNDMLPPPGNVVAERSEDGSDITFSWDPPESPVSNYTLFWCQGRADVNDACLGPLSQQIIPGDVTTFVKARKNKRKRSYVYALSANADTGSSGMTKDWLCVYDYNGLPGEPVFSFDPPVEAETLWLSWEPLLCSTKIRGRVLSYSLELWRDGSKERSLTLPANATSYKFTSLLPYTTYAVKMVALARVGSGESYEKTIRTLESAPSLPPASLKGYMRNKEQVVLSWRQSDAPNGVITKYEVFAMVSGTEVWRVTVDAPAMSLTHDVDGGTNYSFSVVAVNKMGQSPPATPLNLSTPIRAPGQIFAQQLHVDVFNSTVARVQWARPPHPNGPVDNFVVEYTLVDKYSAKIKQTWNETRPGNDMKTNVSVKCRGGKVVTRVRVAAVNRINAENLTGKWSAPRNVTLCENPGGGDTIVVIGISCAVGFLFIVALIIYLIRRYLKIQSKPIPIVTPSRPTFQAVRPPEPPLQDETDDATGVTVVPNDAAHADDRSSLLSEESVDDSGMGRSPDDMPNYSRLAVDNTTPGASGGSECYTEEESESVGVDVNDVGVDVDVNDVGVDVDVNDVDVDVNDVGIDVDVNDVGIDADTDNVDSEQAEPPDEDGSIQPYVKQGNTGPGGATSGGSESDYVDDPDFPNDGMDSGGQSSSAMSSGSGYCRTNKTIPVLQEPVGLPTPINADRPVTHVPSHGTSQPTVAMTSDQTDSSGQSSSAMSSGGYCPGDMVYEMTEPAGEAAEILSGGQTQVGSDPDPDSDPDLVLTLPTDRVDTIQHHTAESVV